MTRMIFKTPSANWEDCFPIGNGFLGAMVQGNPNHEILFMNEDSLYSGWEVNRLNNNSGKHIEEVRTALKEQRVNDAHQLAERYLFANSPHPRHYEPLGQVHIESLVSTDYTDYQRILDVTKGKVDMKYNRKGSYETRTCFISYPRNEMFYTIEGRNINIECYLLRRSPVSGQSESYIDELGVEDEAILLSGYNGNKTNGIDFTMGLNIHSCDGKVEYCDSRIIITDATKVTIGIVGRTSIRSNNPKEWCIEALKKNRNEDVISLLAEHISDFSELFNRSSLQLKGASEDLYLPEAINQAKNGEVILSLCQAYFNFGKYLLISSSRKGSLPANLQGIWSKEFTPPWGSRYTININIQMNYWFCEKLGLGDLHLPLFEFQKEALKNGRRVAKVMYNAEGTVLHHNTDIFGDAAPSDFYMPATIWPMGGIWLALHIFEHYKYSKNDEFLEEYFEVIQENWKFIQSYLFEFNGVLNTGPSVSPENTYIASNGERGQLCISPTMDIQIVREFLNNLLELPERYISQDSKKAAKYMLEKLPKTKINGKKMIMEWQDDYEESEPGHRHISHLFGLFPGNEITKDKTPELYVAALNTLESRLKNGGGHTGWSCAWIINLWAHLNRPKEAFENIKKLFACSTLNNLLDNHPPFQIDGNFGATNGFIELIVQDFGDKVYLLPALPQELDSGELNGFVCKSGIILNIEWKDSNISSLVAISKRNATVEFLLSGQQIIKHFEQNTQIKII